MPDIFIHKKEINEYYKLIGKITVSLTQLEDEMANSIGALISEDVDANIRITAGEPFNNLLRLLDALFRYRISDKPQIDRFNKFTLNANKVNNSRNANVHGVLSFFDIMAGMTLVKKRKYSKSNLGKFKEDNDVPSLETLNILVIDIECAKKELSEIIRDNLDEIKKHHLKMLEINSDVNRANIRYRLKKHLESLKTETQH